MNSLMTTVLSLSLSGSIFIGFLLLFKSLYKNRLSRTWQYYVWLIVVARLLIPFSLFEVNLVGYLFNTISHRNVSTVADVTENEPSFYIPNMVNDVELNVGDIPVIIPQNPIAQNRYPEANEIQTQTPVPYYSSNILSQLIPYIWLIWLTVAVILFIRKLTIYQSFANYIRAGRVELDNIEDLERFGKIVEQLNIKKMVGIYTNSLISSPLLIGFFNPYIVLPTTNISESDFRYTVKHELIHYKRGDMFYKWLVQITMCLHWFNPLVYLMGNEINKACEFSCDEAVIKNLDSNGIKAYGNTLLNALGFGGEYKNALSSVTLGENKKILGERLNMIKNFQNKSKFAIVVMVTITIALGIGAVGVYGITNPIINIDGSSDNILYSISETGGDLYTHMQLSHDGDIVFNVHNEAGQLNVSESGSFMAEDNQRLVLNITSSMRSGSLDLFLFAPDGTEHHFEIGRTVLTISGLDLTEGLWDYYVSGNFTEGVNFRIVGIVISPQYPRPDRAPRPSPTPRPSPIPMPHSNENPQLNNIISDWMTMFFGHILDMDDSESIMSFNMQQNTNSGESILLGTMDIKAGVVYNFDLRFGINMGGVYIGLTSQSYGEQFVTNEVDVNWFLLIRNGGQRVFVENKTVYVYLIVPENSLLVGIFGHIYTIQSNNDNVAPSPTPSPSPSPTPLPQPHTIIEVVEHEAFGFFSNAWFMAPNNVSVVFPEWYTEDMWDVSLVWGSDSVAGTPLNFNYGRHMIGVQDTQLGFSHDSQLEFRIGLPDGETMVINLLELSRYLRENGRVAIMMPNTNRGVTQGEARLIAMNLMASIGWHGNAEKIGVIDGNMIYAFLFANYVSRTSYFIAIDANTGEVINIRPSVGIQMMMFENINDLFGNLEIAWESFVGIRTAEQYIPLTVS